MKAASGTSNWFVVADVAGRDPKENNSKRSAVGKVNRAIGADGWVQLMKRYSGEELLDDTKSSSLILREGFTLCPELRIIAMVRDHVLLAS